MFKKGELKRIGVGFLASLGIMAYANKPNRPEVPQVSSPEIIQQVDQKREKISPEVIAQAKADHEYAIEHQVPGADKNLYKTVDQINGFEDSSIYTGGYFDNKSFNELYEILIKSRRIVSVLKNDEEKNDKDDFLNYVRILESFESWWEKYGHHKFSDKENSWFKDSIRISNGLLSNFYSLDDARRHIRSEINNLGQIELSLSRNVVGSQTIGGKPVFDLINVRHIEDVQNIKRYSEEFGISYRLAFTIYAVESALGERAGKSNAEFPAFGPMQVKLQAVSDFSPTEFRKYSLATKTAGELEKFFRDTKEGRELSIKTGIKKLQYLKNKFNLRISQKDSDMVDMLLAGQMYNRGEGSFRVFANNLLTNDSKANKEAKEYAKKMNWCFKFCFNVPLEISFESGKAVAKYSKVV